MDFASTHVYRYDDSDEECISEDEYELGMQLSASDDDESGAKAQDERRKKGNAKPAEGNKSKLSDFFQSLMPKKSSEPSSSSAAPAKKKMSHWRAPKKRSARAPGRGSGHAQPAPPAGRKWRRADTNVISVLFEKLTEPGLMHTGDPVFCTNCQAVCSHISKIDRQGDKQIWLCEFCSAVNEVELEEEEIPKTDDITFMLEPALTTTASGQSGVDKSLVIFCVDTSGSMCVTTEVPGKIKLRGSNLERLQSLNEERENQFLPREKRNVTYISRLQGMQAAVDHQLGEMERDNPARCVALITFSNEVAVIGDGSDLPVKVRGDRLKDKDDLIRTGKELPLPQPIKQSRKRLGEKVFELEEGGSTALGPALLLAISMASQVMGSKVIICTDGLANVGLGSMDKSYTNQSEDEQQQKINEYYSELASLASDNGICVSVISIKGTECKMSELGQVADATGGQVNIVDPLKLTQEFGTILSNPVIATKVTATMLLHKFMYFRHEENAVGNRVIRNVGNVTKETEITFEYGVKNLTKKKKVTAPPTVAEETEEQMDEQEDVAAGGVGSVGTEGSVKASTSKESRPSGESRPSALGSPEELTTLMEVPFQLQIVYTDVDGAKAMRLLTQNKPITDDRSLAEANLNVGVLGSHTAQLSARMAKQGDYSHARLTSMVNQRLIARNTWDNPALRPQYEAFYDNIAPVEGFINAMQHVERHEMGRSHSEDEDDSDEDGGAAPKTAKKSLKKKQTKRRQGWNDPMASALYKNCSISSKAFKQ